MRRTRKARVLLLVALLALSLAVASTPATVTSTDGGRAVSVVDDGPGVAPAVDPDDYDVALASGRTHWAGQRLYFDGSAVVPDVGSASMGERTFQVRRVSSDDEVGPLVREFVVDADGEAVVDAASLEGEFVVRYDGEAVYVQDGTGYTDSPPDGTAVTVGNSAWEVAVQTLSASWSDDRVFRSQTVDLEVESNRANYLIEVSAAGLDFDDLESMFDPDDYAPDHDALADDVIVLQAGGDVAIPASFADVDDGAYTLSIEVADADAATTADVRVGRVRTTTTTEATATTTTPPEPTVTTAPPTTPAPTTTAPASTATTSAATTAEPETTTAPGQPGFGVLAGALALVAGVVLARRRRA